MSSKVIRNKDELIANLKKLAAAKKPHNAEADLPADPNDAGVQTPPKMDQDNKDTQLPPDSKNEDGAKNKTLVDDTTGTPEEINKPAPKDGNSEDKAYENQMKSLAKTATEIVAKLKGSVKKEASAEETKEESKKEETNTETPKKEASENKKEKKEKSADEIAGNFAEGFTPEFHLKLASVILSTEEGRAFADEIVKREKGMEAAELVIKAASEHEKYEKEEKERREQEMQKIAHEEQLKEAWEEMSDEDKESVKKLAKVHEYNRKKLKTDLEKEAYDAGAGDAAVAMDLAEGGEPLPVEGEDVTVEDVVMVLEQLVAAGEIPPEAAQAILEAFLADTGGGMPVDPYSEELPPEMVSEVEAMPEMGKVASLVEEFAK